MRPHTLARSEHRDTMLRLRAAAEQRCPHCNKPCRDGAALRLHMAVNHPVFPPTEAIAELKRMIAENPTPETLGQEQEQ